MSVSLAVYIVSHEWLPLSNVHCKSVIRQSLKCRLFYQYQSKSLADNAGPVGRCISHCPLSQVIRPVEGKEYIMQ